MVFKKIVINENLYTEENLDAIQKSVTKICAKHNGPLGDIVEEG